MNLDFLTNLDFTNGITVGCMITFSLSLAASMIVGMMKRHLEESIERAESMHTARFVPIAREEYQKLSSFKGMQGFLKMLMTMSFITMIISVLMKL